MVLFVLLSLVKRGGNFFYCCFGEGSWLNTCLVVAIEPSPGKASNLGSSTKIAVEIIFPLKIKQWLAKHKNNLTQ